jgi:hypothetical protein
VAAVTVSESDELRSSFESDSGWQWPGWQARRPRVGPGLRLGHLKPGPDLATVTAWVKPQRPGVPVDAISISNYCGRLRVDHDGGSRGPAFNASGTASAAAQFPSVTEWPGGGGPGRTRPTLALADSDPPVDLSPELPAAASGCPSCRRAAAGPGPGPTESGSNIAPPRRPKPGLRCHSAVGTGIGANLSDRLRVGLSLRSDSASVEVLVRICQNTLPQRRNLRASGHGARRWWNRASHKSPCDDFDAVDSPIAASLQVHGGF